MSFEFKPMEIPEVILITPQVFSDTRGFFSETFKSSDFEKAGIPYRFVQENHSRSKKNVLRGLHYQLNPKSQGKLVRAIAGSILDVAVDLRKGSPFYGKYVSHRLSSQNKMMLWIPPGFAHGFLSLEKDTEVLYKTTEEYSPKHEWGIIWNDPDLNIPWGIENPEVSAKDLMFPIFKKIQTNFNYTP
jgi:dTDP-4-dehydrorhamnose 3,5-epimerase